MNLIIEYFNSRNHMRNGEYLYCLHQNLANELIDNVYLFMEDDAELNFNSSKIHRMVRENRPTYKDLFDFCNQELEDQICVVANADIIFDDTLRFFKSLDMSKQFYALSRWEISTKDGKNWEIEPYDNSASQDSWIFKTPISTSDSMNYTMGKPGCDNKITYHMRELEYTCRNPGKKVVTIHFHPTNFRTYDIRTDRVPGPYLLIAPVDNFTGEPVCIDIDGFDEQGRAYIRQKSSE